MKASKETKRLFVGGLGQNISEGDLQNQFNRFGEVSDVEIITRKDDQGNPQKVFAYVNIRIAEADLKKCMSVLNKTKWKGGTLQIQLAKESFLHRLAQEREEAKAAKEKPTAVNTNLLEKMGVVDFHVKAVPGTEVPGHKNWVVSKFGRVLPVLHLKNRHKRKIIKYDPSKYCHNLKKIGEDFTNANPISNLTWELEGGNDPISKKRRGEFSDFHSPPKKIIKVQKNEGSTASPAVRPKPSRITERPWLKQQAAQKTPDGPITPKLSYISDSESQILKNVFFQTSGLETTKNRNSMSDDDIDSEDELRLTIAREENLEKSTWPLVNESENDPFEVVRDDFKSDSHKFHTSIGLGLKNNISSLDSEDNVMGNDYDSDSGDTDEIITRNKNAGKIKNSIALSQMEKSIHKKTSSKNRKKCDLSDSIKEQKRKNNVEIAVSHRVKMPSRKSLADSSGSEDADSASESAESGGDKEYHTMMNCVHVTLTLADLEQLASSNQEAPKEDTESNGQETTAKRDRASKSHRTLGGLHKGHQCINPEEIVASLLEGKEDTCGKQKPREDLKPKFQAFKGVGCLYRKESVKESSKESVASNNKDHNSLILDAPRSISMEKWSLYANDLSGEPTSFQHAKKANDSNKIQPQKKQSTFESQEHEVVSPSNSGKRSRNPTSSLLPVEDKKSLSVAAKTPRRGFDEDSCHRTGKSGDDSENRPILSSRKAPEKSEFSRRDTQENKTNFPLPFNSSSDVNAKDKHAEDNQKRLAALEARQKAKGIQKKLVHNALANLDGHPEDKPTHIIFGSNSESETEETSTQEQSQPEEEPVKESMGRASGKLFDSSDDESGSEDDSNRFKIKPQFEGRAGQKLMDLQSHFGTDDRFRMDSRFLESDSEEEQEDTSETKTAAEEEIAAEKLKALNIVQSVLHINVSSSTSKGSVAAKKFKDVIHYDPTRHDHATYERKKDDKPKESKAKRKKKREEAEKLPEVSKEMYYNISVDLNKYSKLQKIPVKKETAQPGMRTLVEKKLRKPRILQL